MRALFRQFTIASTLLALSMRAASAQAVPPPAEASPVPAAASAVPEASVTPAAPAESAAPALAAPVAPQTAEIDGRVLDASTGTGLPGVIVSVVGRPSESATTDSTGKFRLAGAMQGVVRLELHKAGYLTAQSDDFALLGGTAANVTLSLQHSQATGSLRAIAHTTTRASQALQKASVIYKESTAVAIEQQGYYRTGDYLRTLPSVSGDGGTETAGAGDDLYLDIRGIGALETVTLYDGHPIGYGHKRGVNLGYNFDLSPTFALRNVQLTYGSGGSDLIGISAIGGVIDMQTIDPTPDFRASLSQGYGTWANLISSMVATGPINDHLQYAVAGGVQSREGYFRHDHFIEPPAAQDPSAPAGTVGYDSGVYQNDSTYVNRGGLVKLRYSFGRGNQAHLTAHGLFQTSWADRTGNSDIDYQPYPTELAKGKVALAQYNTMGGGTCPGGSFAVNTLSGTPAYVPCQTPQQFAHFNTGYAGAGPAWQNFVVQDYGLKYDTPLGKSLLTLDTFTNNYAQTYDRTFQLPYNTVPGDNPNWENPRVTATGGTFSDELPGTNNDRRWLRVLQLRLPVSERRFDRAAPPHIARGPRNGDSLPRHVPSAEVQVQLIPQYGVQEFDDNAHVVLRSASGGRLLCDAARRDPDCGRQDDVAAVCGFRGDPVLAGWNGELAGNRHLRPREPDRLGR